MICLTDMGNAFAPNMDYAVSRRAFVLDPFAFDAEASSDDPTITKRERR